MLFFYFFCFIPFIHYLLFQESNRATSCVFDSIIRAKYPFLCENHTLTTSSKHFNHLMIHSTSFKRYSQHSIRTLFPSTSHSQFFKQTIPSFTTLCIQIITNIHSGLILQHQLRFPQKLPTELPHSLQNSRSRILHIRRAIRRTIHHTHPPFSLLMHNIERKRSCQHIKLISYSSLSLSIRTRQSQQINPLHFIAPIIDKSLVKQKHILRILHHHIPFVHSSIPSILRLLQIIREAFHPSIASR